MSLLTQTLRHTYRLYADDLQLYAHFKHEDVMRIWQSMENYLSPIMTLTKDDGLLINETKTQILINWTYHQTDKSTYHSSKRIWYTRDEVGSQLSDSRAVCTCLLTQTDWRTETSHKHPIPRDITYIKFPSFSDVQVAHTCQPWMPKTSLQLMQFGHKDSMVPPNT